MRQTPHVFCQQLNSVPHSNDRTLKYFRKLSKNLKQRLYKMYELDFELFGYEAEPYL